MTATQRRVLRWVAGVLAAVGVLAVLVVANVAAQISGGWDEVLDRSHPMPDDPDVVAARELGGATVDAELARVVDEVIVPALAAGRMAQPAPAGPAAMTDRGVGLDSACEVGAHDWKRDDPFDLLCVEIRRAIVASGEESFRSDILALHEALTADGYEPLDEFSGLPQALERAEEATRATGAEPPNAGTFPGAGYRSTDGRFHLDLGFRNFDLYTGQPAPALADDEYAAMVSLRHQSYLE